MLCYFINDMKMMLSVVLYTLLIIFLSVLATECLQCTRACQCSSNITALPNDVCTEEILIDPSASQCSVKLTFDFKRDQVDVQFSVVKRTYSAPTTLHTFTSFYLSAIIVTVEFTCSTTDSCSRDFVRESLNEKMANLSTNMIYNQLKPLLHAETSPITLRCLPSDACQQFQHCNGEAKSSVAQNFNFFTPTGCAKLLEVPMLVAEENINTEPYNPHSIRAEIWCDIDNLCNSIDTMNQVYTLTK